MPPPCRLGRDADPHYRPDQYTARRRDAATAASRRGVSFDLASSADSGPKDKIPGWCRFVNMSFWAVRKFFSGAADSFPRGILPERCVDCFPRGALPGRCVDCFPRGTLPERCVDLGEGARPRWSRGRGGRPPPPSHVKARLNVPCEVARPILPLSLVWRATMRRYCAIAGAKGC